MADHLGDGDRELRIADDAGAASSAAPDLAAALGGLDRATRSFTRRFGAERTTTEHPSLADAGAALTGQGRPADEPVVPPSSGSGAPADGSPAAPPAQALDAGMRGAELEARGYLEGAKRRAESLVATMVDAVELEAAEIRRDAEEGIQLRWQQVEVDASRHVENARRVCEQMVAERQETIAALSDEISSRARALTAGMEEAGQVRRDFDAFVRALSVTADQISRDCGEVGPTRDRSGPNAIAA